MHYFAPIVGGVVILQRALVENLIVSTYFPGTNVVLECWTFTNGIVVRVNDYYGRYMGTNLSYANQRVAIWELNGVVSNSVIEARHERIWAGYMTPQESSQLQVYLNNTNLTSLTTGFYTNDLNSVNSGTLDSMVGITNGPAAGRTNVLPNAVVHPGRLLIIRDSGGTAAGTNVWVLTQHGQTINNGPTRTNINVNYGSLYLYSDGANWIMK
jgi:hypothetical protein